MAPKLSRRNFLKAAALAAVPSIVPASVFGQNAPSNRINVAHIGVGKQGQSHVRWLSSPTYPDVRIVAIADVDKMSREQAYQYACTGYKSDKPGIDLYNDFREVLARPDVDAVLIAVPDHWHATAAVYAARAGKDIYCEKPLSLTVRDAQAMVGEARRHGVVFQTGSQQRSEDAHKFLRACQLVRNGYIGEIKGVWVSTGGASVECDLPEEPVPAGLDWNFWLGPAQWRPFNSILRPPNNDTFPHWRDYRDFSGGGMTDWGAHHFDIAQWGLGKDGSGPVKVLPPDATHKGITYIYDNGIPVHHEQHPDQPEGTGVYFVGTAGWIAVNRSLLETFPYNLRGLQLKPTDDHLYVSPGHHRDWLNCIRSRALPICDVEIGASTATVCHIGNICYWLNRPLQWDPAKKVFINDDEANQQLGRAARDPWPTFA